MLPPDFCVIDLIDAIMQTNLFDFSNKFIKRVTSFGAEEDGCRGTLAFQQVHKSLNKAFVKFCKESAARDKWMLILHINHIPSYN